MSATILVGLIGLGWLGARHARHIAAGARGTRAVVASSGERTRPVADEIGARWTAGGATGLAVASRFARYGYDIRGEVEGSLDEVEILGAETLPHLVRTATIARSEVTPPLRDAWFWNRFREAFGRELDTFIDAVRGTAQPAATLDDGLAALRIGVAAIRSVEAGRPIALEEI